MEKRMLRAAASWLFLLGTMFGSSAALAVNMVEVVTTGFSFVNSMAVSSAGTIYVADGPGNRVYRLSADRKTKIVVAGTGAYGFEGDGGDATKALLANPLGVAVDSVGNIYISDANNQRIRRVDTSGVITTVAGNGTRMPVALPAPALSWGFNNPYGLRVDQDDNLYLTDASNSYILKVDMRTGVMSRIAGNGQLKSSLDTEGTLADKVALGTVWDVDLDASGRVYMAEGDSYAVTRVDVDGRVRVALGTRNMSDPDYGFGYPVLATRARTRSSLFRIAVQPDGTFYIADMSAHCVAAVRPDGVASTIMGITTGIGVKVTDGKVPAVNAAFDWAPGAVRADIDGNLLVGDGGRILKVTWDRSIPAGAAEFNLQPGWSLLSNATKRTIPVREFFPMLGDVTTVWAWRRDTARWAFFTPTLTDDQLAAYAREKNYDVLTDIKAGEGFWVNAANQTVMWMPYGPDPVTTADWAQPLMPGWNLVGSGDQVTLSSVEKALNAAAPAAGKGTVAVTTMWTWLRTQSNWCVTIPSMTGWGELDTYRKNHGYPRGCAGQLQIGEGMWMNVTVASGAQ